MTERTCVVHVGTPKAGSTTLQGFLQQRRSDLAARGVDVPLFPENDVVDGGRALAGALSRETDPAAPRTASWRWLDRRIAETGGDLVISRESFCMHLADPRQLSFLTGFFGRRGVRLKLVAYVRDSVGFLNAQYSQNAKKLRLGESFEHWIEPVLASPAPRFSTWRMFRRALESTEAELVVRPLAALGPAGLIPDLLAHLGRADLDVGGFDETPFRNATPGPKAIAAGLAIGRIVAERGIDARANQHLAKAFRTTLAERGWDEKPFFGPDAALARRIAERFADDNDRLARAAWGTSWDDRVSRRDIARNVFDAETAGVGDRADVEHVVESFIARHLKPSLWSRLRRRGARS